MITPVIVLELMVWDIIKAVHQIRVSKDIVNDLMRIVIP